MTSKEVLELKKNMIAFFFFSFHLTGKLNQGVKNATSHAVLGCSKPLEHIIDCAGELPLKSGNPLTVSLIIVANDSWSILCRRRVTWYLKHDFLRAQTELATKAYNHYWDTIFACYCQGNVERAPFKLHERKIYFCFLFTKQYNTQQASTHATMSMLMTDTPRGIFSGNFS